MTFRLPDREPAPVRERDIQAAIVVAENAHAGVRLTRNNSGKSPRPCGPCAQRLCQACRARLMRPITFGLGDGSPDLVGVVSFGGPHSVFPELAQLDPVALAFGIEVKTPHAKKQRHEPDQIRWRNAFEKRGLLSTIARSEEDAATWMRGLVGELADRVRELARRLP